MNAQKIEVEAPVGMLLHHHANAENLDDRLAGRRQA
jgi:hypothetical protein